MLPSWRGLLSLPGAVLADNVGTGFDGKPITYAGAKGAPLDVSC